MGCIHCDFKKHLFHGIEVHTAAVVEWYREEKNVLGITYLEK